jgi:hypothetical protein
LTDIGTTFRRQKMDDARRQTFLAALRESGSYGHAARVASPMSKHPNGCIASFRDEERRRPEFAEAVKEAQAEADAALLIEARRRAITGWQEAVYQKGQRVYDVDPKTGEPVPATIRRYSDAMLAILLKGRMKEFNEKFVHQTVTGQIDHTVTLNQPGLVIYRSELPWLTSEQRRTLAAICMKLAQVRGDAPPDAEAIEMRDITPEPATIEHQAIAYDPWEEQTA